ncbi:hypothetical protein MRX96_017280 [Rhipicephalus microplus]
MTPSVLTLTVESFRPLINRSTPKSYAFSHQAAAGRGGMVALADLFPFSASPNVSGKEERRVTLVFLLVFAAMLAASAGSMLLVLLLVHLLSDKQHGPNETVYETTIGVVTNGSNAAVI